MSMPDRRPILLDVPMSDGATLSAHRYPADSSPAPAVVLLTPYRKDSFMTAASVAPLLGRYEVIVADVRGFGGSTGADEGPQSPRQAEDGRQLLEWVADQDFCVGRTAMVGGSALGQIQLLIAARKPRGLRCITPVVAPVDFYRDWTHRGGIPSHTSWGATAYFDSHQGGTRERGLAHYYQEVMGQDEDGELFRARSAEPVLGDIDVPTLCVGGWHDYFLRGTVRAFQGLTAPKRLVIDNISHDPTRSALVAEETDRWLRHWLLDEGEDPTAKPNVRVSVAQTDKVLTLSSWPRVDELVWQDWPLCPSPVDIPVVTTVHAVHPPAPALEHVLELATNSGRLMWGESWTADVRSPHGPVALLGPVALHVRARVADCRDFDLHARLSVVRADGGVHPINEGRLRASHRALDEARTVRDAAGNVIVPWHTHVAPAPIPTDRLVSLDVEIPPVSVELAAGEALRVGLTLARSDAGAAPTLATILPATRLRVPRRPEVG